MRVKNMTSNNSLYLVLEISDCTILIDFDR